MQRHTTCCSGAPVNFVNFEQLTLYFQHAGEFESASDYGRSVFLGLKNAKSWRSEASLSHWLSFSNACVLNAGIMKSTPLPLKAMNNKVHGPYHNMVVSCCFLLPIIDSPMKPLACELQLWLIVVSRLIEAECFRVFVFWAECLRCEANSPGDTRGAKRSSRFSRNPSVASAVRTWKLSLHLRGQGQHFSALNTKQVLMDPWARVENITRSSRSWVGLIFLEAVCVWAC